MSGVLAVECAPWCDFPDGHTREWCRADQRCHGDEEMVPISNGDQYDTVGALPRLDHHPVRQDGVVLHVVYGDADIDPHLTPAAARELAAALVDAADKVDAVAAQD